MTASNVSRTAGFAALAITACAGLAAPAAQATTLAAMSSASALGLSVTIAKSPSSTQTIALPNLALAQGSAPPDYRMSPPSASYSKTVNTSDGKFSFVASATKVRDSVSSTTSGTSYVKSMALSSIGSFSASLIYNPFSITALTVSATNIESKATFKLTSKGAGASTGSTTITKITVNAPLLGINNVTFAGTPSVDYVLYQNTAKTITIYLNAETVTSVSKKKTSVKVDAIDVHFANYTVPSVGDTVSGDVEIGTTYAN